jgi:WD40 repeat protein
MFIWQAHEGAVTSLAFAPGAGLVSAGVDGNVRFWDPATGSLIHGWKLSPTAENDSTVSIVRVLADASGKFAAVGLRDEGLLFFNLADGSAVADFLLYEVTGMAPAPDGASVFVVGRPRDRGRRTSRRAARVFQHAYPPSKVLAQSEECRRWLGMLAVSPTGTQVRSGGARFSWPDGKLLDPIVIHHGGSQLAVSWDGEKLFGIDGSRLLVSSFDFGVVRQRLKGHVAPIAALTATPDGRKIWTASADATVRQWDAETYRCEKCYALKIGPLGCVAVSPDGLTAAAGSALRGTIAMWDLE